uniref:F5/8 type C domain-containing protein n=1 Tax=Leptobrachium leishanense TaxID=445787 RepID=A0A8C5WCI0_9ANUR
MEQWANNEMKHLILLLACGAVGWAQSCDPQPGALNLARSGQATQSSVYSPSPSTDASKAIDGNTATSYYSYSCATTLSNQPAWWRLDLNRSMKVQSVIITNRQDCCPERLIGAQIKIGNSADGNNPLCGTIKDVSKARVTVCCNGMEGRYLSVTISDRNEYLTLCEVEVYGSEVSVKNEPSVCW